MISRHFAILCCSLLALGSCRAPTGNPDTEELLPFFRDPNLTPEWIDTTDPAFNAIHQIPAFKLTDQMGRPFTEADMNDRICVTNFFFARCRSICPRMTLQLKYLLDSLGKNADIRILSYSVDPESDSVAVLRTYARQHGIDDNNWRFLTGDKTAIYRLARKEYFAGDSVGYYQAGDEFLHTENVILTDRKRRIRGVYNGTLRTEMDRLREDILRLDREQ